MRSLLRRSIVVGALAGLLLPTMASASVSSFTISHSPTTTSAKIDSWTNGTGSIRAWQYCESTNGQTNWYSYGPWRSTLNTWSTTGTCTIILSYHAQYT
jgi:hypothetical protein